MTASKSRGRGSGLVQFDSRATTKSIKVAARNALGQFTKFQGAVLKTNQRSLKYIMEAASENLDKSITAHGRPQNLNSGRLKRAIEDPSNHSATVDGFEFMQDAKVRADVPYYRSIERGSNRWVGKRLPFLFLDGNFAAQRNNPSRRRDPIQSQGRRNDAIIGPRQYKLGGVQGPRFAPVIRNPVPRYAYAAKARREFLRERIYERFLMEEAAQFERDTGAKVTFTSS